MNIEMDDDFGVFEDDNLSVRITLKKLIALWINERNSPELLPYDVDTVDSMMDQVDQMEENLLSLNRDDFRVVPHQMEVNRIRYLLASYHRCRLEKIETFSMDLIRRDEAASQNERIMSGAELRFAKEFEVHRNHHFYSQAHRYIPGVLAWEAEESQGGGYRHNIPEIYPNLQSYVFFEVLKSDVPQILGNGGKTIELPKGSRHILPYEDVQIFVKNGSGALI